MIICVVHDGKIYMATTHMTIVFVKETLCVMIKNGLVNNSIGISLFVHLLEDVHLMECLFKCFPLNVHTLQQNHTNKTVFLLGIS